MNKEKEIREMRRNIRNMGLAGAGAIAMFAMAATIYFEDAPSVNTSAENVEKPAPILIPVEEPAIEPASAAKEVVSNDVADLFAISPIAKTEGKVVHRVEEIQSFDVSCNNGNLQFSWVTEGSGKYAYEVERSTDNENFEVFTYAPAPEKKDGLNYYAVEETAESNDMASYRLKKVISKSKSEYTDPISVKCMKKPVKDLTVDVFPAGYGAFRILIDSPVADDFEVTLTDATENVINRKTYSAVKGNNEFRLESDQITKGTYHLRITGSNTVKDRKVIIK